MSTHVSDKEPSWLSCTELYIFFNIFETSEGILELIVHPFHLRNFQNLTFFLEESSFFFYEFSCPELTSNTL